MNKLVDDAACIAEWRTLLQMFHDTIKDSPKAEDVKDQLASIKEMAKVSKVLTYHQVDGITARCNNYLNGSYGNSKKPEHYSQEHNFSTNGKMA